jgi:putative membrane protein
MLWLKAFHIVAVVTWFAALFYLPRLYVYHAMADDQISKDRFKIMERKLYRGIMTPSMIAVLILGFWMISYNPSYYFSQGWMHAKLALVAFLVGYHFMCGALRKKFEQDANDKSHVFYRWFNEVPVLFLIAVVILVVVRPF